MPVIDPQNFYKQFETQQFSPLYFLFGDEPYLSEQAFFRFKESLLSESDLDFNFSLFYAAEANMEHVKDAVETLPMMKDRRVVVLKEAHELNDKEWGALEALFVSPVESTLFLIMAGKIDKRKKAVRLLMDKATTVEFKKPYDNQIPGWVRYIAGHKELKIEDEAIHHFHRLVGNNLSEIDSELEKLKEYLGGRNVISAEDVLQVVSRSKEENIFDFTRAVGRADRVSALEQLVHLLDQGQSEVGVVSLLARHIRTLMQVRRGMDLGYGGSKLAQFSQVPPYFLESYLDQMRHWNPRKLENMTVLLSETDKALKSSPLSAHIWLENLVLKACEIATADRSFFLSGLQNSR